MPDAYIQELLGWVQGAKLLQDVSPHLRALVSQMMQATHFQTAGGSCIHETYAGVRPGDAIADVLYSFLQADFLRALRMSTSSPIRMPFMGPAWKVGFWFQLGRMIVSLCYLPGSLRSFYNAWRPWQLLRTDSCMSVVWPPTTHRARLRPWSSS